MISKAEVISKANNGNVKESPKSNQSTEKSRTTKITVKVSALWHFVADYLEMLNSSCAVCDEEFLSRFNKLMEYVYGKIDISNVKNILDEYVVYEVEV